MFATLPAAGSSHVCRMCSASPPVIGSQVRQLAAEDGSLADRVVEIKFLAGSDRTLLGPNTRDARPKPLPLAPHACLNLWWRVPADAPGGRPYP
eukprot:2938871-Pyramimonas_sp.AAC.1